MPRKLLVGGSKLYLTLFFLTFLAALMLPRTARGQGLEVSGGWVHVTQDFGTDGFQCWSRMVVHQTSDHGSGVRLRLGYIFA
jgi:hypothetical protein